MEGAIELVEAGIDQDFETFFGWVNEIKTMTVEANADTPKDVENALKYGAKGVGLCRTEHMFMDPIRLPWVQKMIIAKNKEEREEALNH